MEIDWKEKLAAYLHDPPSKALDIKTHNQRSETAYRQAGFFAHWCLWNKNAIKGYSEELKGAWEQNITNYRFIEEQGFNIRIN